ncbi:hypothetical protein [Catellatospora chokoriensis]|uniref:Uncharacterized protein n=1 Tax=Catellatospora chokoriensis TaxID=310353 RepID=A0A8J3K567_9ACTN|nr:hypothetical protein [Catellatospora chokoriensis]GIF89689.1 hypothetical protein Cch02nite_31330 [Catellatospora chokoriensis]
MNEYRDTMDEYVGTAPHTAIDIDELVGRGRRAQLGRRLAVASGGLALSAVAAVSALSLFGAMTPAPGPLTPAVTSAAASAAVSPAAETQEQTAARLQSVLKAAIAREMPGVTGLETLQRQMHRCITGGAELVPYDAATYDTACPAGTGFHDYRNTNFTWRAQLTVGNETTSVRILVTRGEFYDPWGPPVNDTDAEERRLAEEAGRGPTRGPDGEAVYRHAGGVRVNKPSGVHYMVTQDRKRLMSLTDAWVAVGLDPALRF